LTLILGEAGSGKTSSMRNLNPKETFIINVIDKPLPMRGYKKLYQPVTNTNPKGNYFATDDYARIVKCIKAINERKEIKTLVIDDIQYVLAHAFLRRATEKGFDKFSELA